MATAMPGRVEGFDSAGDVGVEIGGRGLGEEYAAVEKEDGCEDGAECFHAVMLTRRKCRSSRTISKHEEQREPVTLLHGERVM